jgi:alkylation response protein AidB-like acyl-CoA dehydrogenase
VEFRFTDEQQMIRETAAAFLRERSDAQAVRRAMASERGFDEALWAQLSGEMGWSAMHFPEEYGGLGLGFVEVVALMEEMGKRLLCAPFFSSVCLGGSAILCAATDEQKAELLPGIADGSVRATLAWTGASLDWGAGGIGAICRRARGSLAQRSKVSPAVGERPARDPEAGWVINGEYRYVVDGHTASLLVVAARLEGTRGPEGIRLFAFPADTAGIHREWLPTVDQTRKLAVLRLDNVRLGADALLGDDTETWPALAKALALATIALAAEQAGTAQQVLEMAVEYTKERQQFGRSIASFQAIKHKAADMLLRAEAARSAVYYAACIADEALSGGALGTELGQAASLAKAYCSDAGFFNAGSALQMYGGVGFTWEYDLHLYFKRARASEAYLGAPHQHRERIAEELGL